MSGQDLRALVMTRRTQAHIQRLTTRALRLRHWSRRRSPACSAAIPAIAEAAARLDLYAEEGDGPWTGEVSADGHGFIFSRIKRGVSERIVLDEGLLHAPWTPSLADRAAQMADTFSKPPPSAARTRASPSAGRSTWSPPYSTPGARSSIQRYKGLGEVDPEQLWETTLDKEARTLLQVRVDHDDDAGDLFSRLMGDLVDPAGSSSRRMRWTPKSASSWRRQLVPLRSSRITPPGHKCQRF